MGKICTFCKHKKADNRCALIFSNASVKQTERCWNYEPVEDVAPVVHAKWTAEKKCSNCKEDALWDDRGGDWLTTYCPNCGARMDGGEL